MTQDITVHGTVAEGFEAVREEFARFVAGERADYEGQVCAYVHGRRVVDLWAGGEADSLYGVFSATKGAAHLVVALLVQDGTLELDRKVTYYWPEFGCEGKESVTLRELITHQAGVIGTDAGFSLAELADDRAMAERLADQRPFWRPGKAFGYHGLVIGALTGEVVRRVLGRTLQEVYEERIRAPYGTDFHLGLPESEEPRFRSVQSMILTPEQQALAAAQPPAPRSLMAIAGNRHVPDPVSPEDYINSRPVRAQGPASGGGVASARGLARMYASAISEVDDRSPLLKPDALAEVAQIHCVGYDVVLRAHKAYALGFQATSDTIHPFLGAGTFGHEGAGGVQAFADPHTGLAYGYTRRRRSLTPGAAPENNGLVAALHRAALAL
ncbi:serine hydrolase domain-containing protein [Streptomyces sp. NPDC127190]|uniref:serine hydrolase domain-containing protein n=1 Tax=unclassified Streptomyces TaxID=2593676 RepID=UPI00363197AD